MKYQVTLYILFILLFSVEISQAQVKIGGNPTTIDDEFALVVESTNKAFVPSRVTTAQMNNVPTPLVGAVVFNTTENCLRQFKATDGWVSMCLSPSDIETRNITVSGTTATGFGKAKIDVPSVTHTFTPTKDGVLIVGAHGLALPLSTNENSSQGAFYLDVNNVKVDAGYYSTFDGQGLLSLGGHVPLNYTAILTAGTIYTIKFKG